MVDFQEFLCLMIKFLFEADQGEEELVTVFKRFDKDGDGEISSEDLRAMMNELGYDVDVQEAQDMVMFFDNNDDQRINFEEFVQLMMYDTMDDTVEVTKGQKKI